MAKHRRACFRSRLHHQREICIEPLFREGSVVLNGFDHLSNGSHDFFRGFHLHVVPAVHNEAIFPSALQLCGNRSKQKKTPPRIAVRRGMQVAFDCFLTGLSLMQLLLTRRLTRAWIQQVRVALIDILLREIEHLGDGIGDRIERTLPDALSTKPVVFDKADHRRLVGDRVIHEVYF